jgi:ubiquinone/menaquinone biosynthesis C-methylase UbiE
MSSSQPSASAQPSPQLFFETINAYQRTEALKAAIELDLFTAIDNGNNTAASLAKHLGAAERGVRILADYLTMVGFLTKQDSRYALTPDSAMFLSRKSPACLNSAVRFLASPMLTDYFKNLTAVVRKGGTVAGEGSVEPDHPMWVDFARGMAPMMQLPAQMIAQTLKAEEGKEWKVLDIAAGHGTFGITIAKKNPNAKITAVDWKNVLEVAKENAQKAGVADRYSTIAGSAFDVDFGTGYDVALVTNFLHHFDMATNERFMRKVYAALKPGGRAATLEFVPNEDRVSPPQPAGFALIMLTNTPAGDAFTYSELDQMLRNAGFSKNELHALPPTPQSVVVSVK